MEASLMNCCISQHQTVKNNYIKDMSSFVQMITRTIHNLAARLCRWQRIKTPSLTRWWKKNVQRTIQIYWTEIKPDCVPSNVEHHQRYETPQKQSHDLHLRQEYKCTWWCITTMLKTNVPHNDTYQPLYLTTWPACSHTWNFCPQTETLQKFYWLQ